MGKRLWDLIFLPFVLLVGGWAFWSLCSLAVDQEQSVGILFMLWLGSIPLFSGWSLGRHAPWPLKPRVIRCVLVWWGMILLVMGVIPVFCPFWLLLLLLLAVGILVILGAWLGAGYAMTKQ